MDVVLQFDGDKHYMYRILRGQKNRFGSTAELGIYEMRQSGLRPVENPSEHLMTQSDLKLSGTAIAVAMEAYAPSSSRHRRWSAPPSMLRPSAPARASTRDV